MPPTNRELHANPDKNSPLGLYELVYGFGRGLTRTCDVLGPLVAQLQDLAEAQDAEIAAILATISSLSGLPANMEVTIIPEDSYTTAQTSLDQDNESFKRLLLMVNISANVGAVSLVPSLQVKDSVSGSYVSVWTGKPLTSTGTFAYYFADGANSGSFTETRGFGLPAKTWRIVLTPGNASTLTYSVSGTLMT